MKRKAKPVHYIGSMTKCTLNSQFVISATRENEYRGIPIYNKYKNSQFPGDYMREWGT